MTRIYWIDAYDASHALSVMDTHADQFAADIEESGGTVKAIVPDGQVPPFATVDLLVTPASSGPIASQRSDRFRYVRYVRIAGNARFITI
jgi:hypothetical protein